MSKTVDRLKYWSYFVYEFGKSPKVSLVPITYCDEILAKPSYQNFRTENPFCYGSDNIFRSCVSTDKYGYLKNINNNLHDILGLYALIEVMRTLITLNDLYDKSITSEKNSLIAGRYFASRCQANVNQISYGLYDMDAMQRSLDSDYPKKYNLVAYKNRSYGKYIRMFEGNEDNPHNIFVICYCNYETLEHKYFGYFGNESEICDLKLKIE